MLFSESRMSDHKGAVLILPALPAAKELLADCGHDSNWFRAGLATRSIEACILPTKACGRSSHTARLALYRQQLHIENAFGRLKDWRRIATRYSHNHLMAGIVNP